MSFNPPPNAVPIEYIESTGTQWIDTGVSIPSDHNVSMVVDGQFTALTGDYAYCSVVNEDTQKRSRLGIGWRTPGTWSYPYGNYGNILFGTADTNRHTFHIDAGNGTYGIDQSTYICPQTDGWGTDNTIYLFASNNWGTAASFASMRIYSAKFSKAGTIVRDFIPVRVGRFGYLFDRVTGKFFANQGTGDFLLGPDIGTIPGRLHPMGVASWGAGWKPYDAEVEYLETVYPDAAWVDLGVYLQYGDSVKLRYMATNIPTSVNNGGIFGNEAMSGTGIREKSWELTVQRSHHSAMIRLLTYTIYGSGFTISTDVWNDFEMHSATTPNFIVNGGAYTYNTTVPPGDYVCTATAHVFGIYSETTQNVQNVGWGRLAYLQIYRGGVLLCDFIPVRVGSIGYLYDRANPTGGPLGNGLYPNSGTGSFVIGPDIS